MADKLASQHQPAAEPGDRPPYIVPSEALVALAVTLRQQTDDVLALVKVVGQIAERLEETKIIDWLTPHIIAITARQDTMSAVLSAIVEENPNGKR